MIKNLMKVQDSYINTYHPDFMGGANSIFDMFDPQKLKTLSESNQNQKMQL